MAIAAPYEGRMTEEHPRLTLLREFLQMHYQMAETEKVEGALVHRAFSVWAEPRGVAPRHATHFYADLRYFGFMVRPGNSNKTMVFGISPRAEVLSDLADLEAAWDNFGATASERQLQKGVVKLAGAAIREAIEIKREIIEEMIADVREIARTALDERVRLQAYEMLLSRSWPKVAPRVVEPQDDAIDVPEVAERPSLAEVEAIITKRMVGGG